MRKVKKVLALLLAVVMVVGFAACASDKDKEGMAIRRILNIASDEETGIMKYYPIRTKKVRRIREKYPYSITHSVMRIFQQFVLQWTKS